MLCTVQNKWKKTINAVPWSFIYISFFFIRNLLNKNLFNDHIFKCFAFRQMKKISTCFTLRKKSYVSTQRMFRIKRKTLLVWPCNFLRNEISIFVTFFASSKKTQSKLLRFLSAKRLPNYSPFFFFFFFDTTLQQDQTFQERIYFIQHYGIFTTYETIVCPNLYLQQMQFQ